MELREFQMAIHDRGTVDVSFNLHFDSRDPTVGEIKIHSDFESGLPHRAQLKQEEGNWKLFAEHPVMEAGEVKIIPQFLNDELSISIAKKILYIKEEAILLR